MARHVDRPAEHIGRGVAHERYAADVGEIPALRAFNRVVRGHVDVGGAGRQGQFGLRRHSRIAVGLRGGGHVDGADPFRFLDGFLGPRSAVDVIGRRAGRQEVHRYHRELQARPALQEEHAIAGRDAGERPTRTSSSGG